jgi:cytochrome c oxidase subunit 4
MAQRVLEQAPPREHGHPSELSYVAIAIILAIITSIEVAVYYIELLHPYLLPILLALSVVKFFLVAAYFMHLKFDSKLFVAFFGGGLTLAVSLGLSLILLLHIGGGYSAPAPPAGGAPAEHAPTPEAGHG